ncbi:MAG TPA: phospholipase D-like domain-containing protein [Chryseolinea sp.]|nr:phospholipase D-like domain-containing protein [Flavobacteriales bacterium]HPM31304.1 phospholipase D-like domain-containing protein [Chryseolinea sp.]
MDHIIHQLKQSLDDDFLSKPERKSLSQALEDQFLDTNQITFLRTKVFELANEKVNDKNYRFILEWIKDASNVLSNYPLEKSKSDDSYFSPGDHCRNAIVQHLNLAKKRLKICVFTISDDIITEAILRAKRRGVDVMVLTDNDKSFDLGSDIEKLSKAGISVKMDQTSDHMHHKFMIVDTDAVLSGSYNWTRSAARFNHENVVVMKEEGVVKSFMSEFDKLWSEMSDY